MSQDRGCPCKDCDDDQPIGLLCFLDDGRRQDDRQDSLGKIEKEGGKGPSLSKCPAQVRGADVSAALLTDIDTMGFADEQPEGDATQEIRPGQEQVSGSW